jgi:acyl dehydratase
LGQEQPVTALRDSRLVTRTDIQRFAVAIGALNPEYHDVCAARTLGYRDLVAPPFFFATLGLSIGRTLPSAQLRPDGMPKGDDLSGRVVAGETAVRWLGPIVAGDQLSLEQRIIDRYTKQGRQGLLNFAVYERTYSVDERVVVIEQLTRIGKGPP